MMLKLISQQLRSLWEACDTQTLEKSFLEEMMKAQMRLMKELSEKALTDIQKAKEETKAPPRLPSDQH